MCSPLSLRPLNEKEPSMQYKTILDATFLSRPNRVKNTGRCKELLLPGADVRLEV